MSCSLDFNAGVGLVQMMGTTNYLALVGGGRFPKFASNKVSNPEAGPPSHESDLSGHHLGRPVRQGCDRDIDPRHCERRAAVEEQDSHRPSEQCPTLQLREAAQLDLRV